MVMKSRLLWGLIILLVLLVLAPSTFAQTTLPEPYPDFTLLDKMQEAEDLRPLLVDRTKAMYYDIMVLKNLTEESWPDQNELRTRLGLALREYRNSRTEQLRTWLNFQDVLEQCEKAVEAVKTKLQTLKQDGQDPDYQNHLQKSIDAYQSWRKRTEYPYLGFAPNLRALNLDVIQTVKAAGELHRKLLAAQ